MSSRSEKSLQQSIDKLHDVTARLLIQLNGYINKSITGEQATDDIVEFQNEIITVANDVRSLIPNVNLTIDGAQLLGQMPLQPIESLQSYQTKFIPNTNNFPSQLPIFSATPNYILQTFNSSGISSGLPSCSFPISTSSTTTQSLPGYTTLPNGLQMAQTIQTVQPMPSGTFALPGTLSSFTGPMNLPMALPSASPNPFQSTPLCQHVYAHGENMNRQCTNTKLICNNMCYLHGAAELRKTMQLTDDTYLCRYNTCDQYTTSADGDELCDLHKTVLKNKYA